MTANDVDRALGVGQAGVARAILDVPEDQWFDRKSTQISAKDLAPHLVAFANAEGGTIVIGASKGRVMGTRTFAAKLNDFRQAPVDFTVPPVRAAFGLVPCVNDAGDEDDLLVIRIDPGERVHETQNGDSYLRIGDESRKLNYQQRQELEFDKGQAQYDGFPAEGITLRNLDRPLLTTYRDVIGATNTVTAVLRNRSLLTRKGEITNAAYLLFGKHPQDLFPQAYIRVVKFLTIERGTGARLGIEDTNDIRIEGPVPEAIASASGIIDSLVPRRRSLANSGLFEARPIVPRDAWLEGLVNAVVHRSYSLAGDHIRIEIYPNRIEIESPGRFPGLADPTNPLEISRFARNPRIARVCADLRIGQELGEGIKRIFEEMRRVGLTDPVYKQSGGSVRLFLTGVPRLDPRVAARLPRGSQRFLDTMRAAERPLSTGDLSAATGYSRPATTTRLRALESEGLVRWVGNSQRDPRAHWVLTE